MDESIIKKVGEEKGKTLAIFAGMHGNEKAGVFALNKLLKDIEIKKGVVYFVFANPEAIAKSVRHTGKNLNRCFCKNNNGSTYEESRAKELMKILDNTDALLDVHSSQNSDTVPFAITEEDGFGIVSKMNFETVVKNFDEFEPCAADGYMKNNNKIGICLECGYLGESEKNIDLAYNSMLQFLQFFGAIDKQVEFNNIDQKVLEIDGIIKYDDASFELSRDFYDFETVPANTLIAKSGNKDYVTKKERVILFGIKMERQIGDEAAVLGSWVKE